MRIETNDWANEQTNGWKKSGGKTAQTSENMMVAAVAAVVVVVVVTVEALTYDRMND